MSQHFGLDFEYVKNNLDKQWNWSHISRNYSVKWKYIQNNPDLPWDWRQVSSNYNIDLNILKNNMDKPWDFKKLSINEKIDLNFIKEHSNKNWSNKFLGMKEFRIDFKDEKKKVLEKFIVKIQRWWIDIYYNPKSRVRQRILNQQYDELSDANPSLFK